MRVGGGSGHAARLGTALLAAGLAVGCNGGAPGVAPPEIAYGLDECSRCRMIVSEPRHAAAARSPAGEEARFDDLGCLVEHLRAADDGGAWHAWVHAGGEATWHPAEQAVYVHLPGRITPMGSGLAAFAGKAAARREAAAEEVFTWKALLAAGAPAMAPAGGARENRGS